MMDIEELWNGIEKTPGWDREGMGWDSGSLCRQVGYCIGTQDHYGMCT